MCELHEDSIVHQNMKSSNLLVQIDESKIRKVRITDYLFPSFDVRSVSFTPTIASKQDNVVLFGVILWELGNRLLTGSYSPPSHNLSLPSNNETLSLYVEIIQFCFKKEKNIQFVDLVTWFDQMLSRVF